MDEGKRRLSAVWFADVVGYTSLSCRDEPLALKLVAELQALARPIVEQEFEGRIVKFIGDAILAEFGSTERAVRAAVALQERYTARAKALGTDSTLHVGVHLGEVVATSDGDLYGDGINTAARLQHEAGAGQVLISEDVWRQLRQRPEFRFQSKGPVELKGLTANVEVYNVLFGAGAALEQASQQAQAAHQAKAAPRRSVGVAIALGVVIVAVLAFWMTTRTSSRNVRGSSEPSAASTVPATSPPPVAIPPAAPASEVATPSAAPQPAAAPAVAARSAAPPASNAAPPAVSDRAAAVRGLLEEFAAALATENPGPTVRRLYPGVRPQQIGVFSNLRQQLGPGMKTEVGRIENIGVNGEVLGLRFVVLASSPTHPPQPFMFEGAVAEQGGKARFMRLQGAGPGRRGR